MPAHHDPISIISDASRLAKLHSTGLSYELARKARERGYASWEELLATQAEAIRIALGLRDEWLRPVSPEDGDVGGWDRVPAFNPLAEDALPQHNRLRDDRIAAIVDLLMWTSGSGGAVLPGSLPLATALAAAIIREELTLASQERRVPTLANCDRIFTSWETMEWKGGRAVRDNYDPWLKTLSRLADDRRPWDSRAADTFAALAQMAVGERSKNLHAVRYAFLRFRHPVIAQLAA
ncbi:hypothetical protein [Sphingosinicella sp. BN140058]|uniref:hypothetical protein n=1 Tax=Sphingosinicella sp. BN140058 TaxID=1892855 RepID=UPI00101171C1|nr:hypothetical protein [Sphingosinicella sp. BN140058]QAY80289.1 hypothetical protein ETR14_26975 [Sphingosinicella sp. BN140058]